MEDNIEKSKHWRENFGCGFQAKGVNIMHSDASDKN